ncbi:MAG TPA: hypothetical protein VK715_01090, partial [Steroidobacteraceae bacterium]|nr:hypothetical protein [Steroidobacteraceae bacterium]
MRDCGAPGGGDNGWGPGGDAPGSAGPVPFWLDDWNRPCTRPESDSTRDTPVVISTNRRSPRSTFLPWVS